MTAQLAKFVEAHGRALVLVVLSFALAGIVLMFQVPISIFPQTDFPRIIILVDNGIAPIDVQTLTVTRPLEEAIRQVPGILASARLNLQNPPKVYVETAIKQVDNVSETTLIGGRRREVRVTLDRDKLSER